MPPRKDLCWSPTESRSYRTVTKHPMQVGLVGPRRAARHRCALGRGVQRTFAGDANHTRGGNHSYCGLNGRHQSISAGRTKGRARLDTAGARAPARLALARAWLPTRRKVGWAPSIAACQGTSVKLDRATAIPARRGMASAYQRRAENNLTLRVGQRFVCARAACGHSATVSRAAGGGGGRGGAAHLALSAGCTTTAL